MLHKTFTVVMVLMLQTLATVNHEAVGTTSVLSNFAQLSSSWHLSAEIDSTYWGLYAKKKTITLVGQPADFIDTLGIGYYLSGSSFGLVSGALQTDIDTVKNYLNEKFVSPASYSTAPGLFYVGSISPRRDSLNSYIRIFKLDSIYVAVVIPNSSKINIYKGYLGNFKLKATLSTVSTASILTLSCRNNNVYFLSNNDLYKLSNGCSQSDKIATNVLGYFLDNQGVWLTNSSGELSYLNNGIRSVVKTNSRYVCKIFAVNPVDTTFYYGNRKENSKTGDVYFGQIASLTTYLSDRNIITNNQQIIFPEGDYTCQLAAYTYDLIPNLSTQEFVYQHFDGTTSSLTKCKYNLTPYIYNTNFADSLGHLNSSGMLSYKDTLHAFDYTNGSQLIYSIAQNPIGLVLNDSIISLNANISEGTYTIKFKVRNNTVSDSIIWNLKVFSRKLSISKSVATLASEGVAYSQVILTTDKDDDSSYIAFSMLPSWLTISRLSKNQFSISGTPIHTSKDTVVKLIMTDSSSHYDVIQKQNMIPTYDTLTYNIAISTINIAPVFTSAPITTSTANQQYVYQAQASDDQTITYSLLVAPTAMTISATGLVSWTPARADTGMHLVSISATDALGLIKQQNFMLTVKYTNRAPVLPNDTTITFKLLNTPLSISVKALDPDGDKLIYSIDTTTYNRSSLVVEIKDSIYKVTLKKVISDTLNFIISDGKIQVVYHVRIVADIPTTLVSNKIKKLSNSFSVSNGTIKYSVAKQNIVKLIIFSMNGSTVYKINHVSNAGDYSSNPNLSSGSYIYQFSIGKEFVTSNKMQIIR